MNAIGEELTFRAPLLATLRGITGTSPAEFAAKGDGRQSALWLTSVYFGLAHYLNGDPSGWIGFLLTAFIAYVLGKSIYETRGIFWAWFIHFVADIPIFMLYALNAG